jgi:hypothetical protein
MSDMAFCFSVRGARINTLGHRGFVISKGDTAFHFEAHDEIDQHIWVTALQIAME